MEGFPSRTGISTAYLWREVWTKHSILDLIRRFVQVVDKLDDLVSFKSNTFAVIIDEAHSSQAGETGSNVNRVTSYGKLEESEDKDDETGEDRIEEIMRRRGRMTHVSFFAFTASAPYRDSQHDRS